MDVWSLHASKGCVKPFFLVWERPTQKNKTVSPTFPVLMGMGTVSWRRLCLMASIFCSLQKSSPSLPLSSPNTTTSFLSVSLYLQALQLKAKSFCQKSGLSVHPWGCLPHSHILPLTLLPVVSKEGDEQRYPSPRGSPTLPSFQNSTAHFPNNFRINTRFPRHPQRGGSTGGRMDVCG